MTSRTPTDPQEIAKASTEAMWRKDAASQGMGMSLSGVTPGCATMSFMVRPEMSNGHGTCHGGFIFSLADSAFAFACNSYGSVAVAQHCSITYINPARVGDCLTAVAREVSRSGRNGIYDVSITNQNGLAVAEFRGHSRTLEGRHLE